jgi:DNA-directed RNA polymerase subunit alpha
MEQQTMTTGTSTLDTISEMIESGHLDKAASKLEGIAETEENRHDLAFLRGLLMEYAYDGVGAVTAYMEVLEQEPNHARACFHAALLADRHGDTDLAMELYERCTEMEPVYANALINLAVLYEEDGKLPQAEVCLENVLDKYPSHGRARHFLKSVASSYTMQYDERTQQERQHRSAVLDMPIADFELSVRSRNCLRQMNIRTLGDLLRASENELLSYKNFGETSLNEVKAMLGHKGLELGQAAAPPEPPPEVPEATPPALGAPGTIDPSRSVADLELSVRSRKALQRLGIVALSDLIGSSEAELMNIKNFGQTSLVEIKQQLARFGLSLKQST